MPFELSPARILSALLASFALSVGAAHAEMTLSLAKRVAAAARTEATRLAAPGGAIAVVDGGGHLVYFERLDGTFPAAAVVSSEKARTAAVFRQPTANLEMAIQNGRNALLGVAVMTPLQGGVPIRVSDEVVGAVGVSGAANAAQDTEIANAAAAAVAQRAPSNPVQFFPKRDVDGAFAKGMPLTESADYKVHASRRDSAGLGEVHESDTDVIYVLKGSATVVTGGELVGAKTVAPGELRGSSIAGGEERRLGFWRRARSSRAGRRIGSRPSMRR